MGIKIEAGSAWEHEPTQNGSRFKYAGIDISIAEITIKDGKKVVMGTGWMPIDVYHLGLQHTLTGEGNYHAMRDEESRDPFMKFDLEPEAAIEFFVKEDPRYLSVKNTVG